MRLFRRRASVPEEPTRHPELSSSRSHSGSMAYSDMSSTSIHSDNETINMVDEYMISPTTSIPLSETATLNGNLYHRLELQSTYAENFDHYLPFVLRRLRLHQQQEQQPMANPLSMDNRIPLGNYLEDQDLDDDDLPTVLDEPIESNNGISIIGVNLSNYTVKRDFIIANEFIKHNTYVFPSSESFELFRKLRSQNKKNRKNSITVYEDHELKTVKENKNANAIIDNRNHIIPVNYKSRGQGLPLFKISIPYMSSFRKNSPFMTFHKFKEIPNPPSEEDEEFETYLFCSVTIKKFHEVKRYTFDFPDHKLKLISFQHNFKPFADFTYKSTRFRVLGTSIVSAYALNYNPTLKLLIIDNDKPSLCDNIINKKPGFELSSIIKKKQPIIEQDVSGLDPEDYPNPHPSPNNALLDDSYFQYYNGTGYTNVREYIPNNLPPFGSFIDSIVYDNSVSLLPKKYSEVGKIESYQSPNGDVNSTKSVDFDSLVILVVMMTFRESSIRASARPSSSTAVLSSRLNGRPSAGGLFLTGTALS